MKNLNFLMGLLIALNSVAFAESDSDGASSGGGTGNVEVGGEVYPADFFADLSGSAFPRKNEKPISLKKAYPELYKELGSVLSVITKRNRNVDPWAHKLSSYEIYVVDQLSTPSDRIKTKGNLALIPTAVTYSFSELNKFGKITAEHRVIELDRNRFFKAPLRHQALDLVHEMLHHERHEPRASDHQFISPFITGLHSLLLVIEQQKAGHYSLTDDEYEKIVTMQNMSENIFGKYGLGKDYEYLVYRQGGGVIETRLKDQSKSSRAAANRLLEAQAELLGKNGNLIDALSAVQFEISRVELKIQAEEGSRRSKSADLKTSLELFKNNKIIDSMIDLGLSSEACSGNTISRVNTYVDCQGNDNLISDFASDQRVAIAGERNEISHIGSSISVSVHGRENVVSNIRIPEVIEKKKYPVEGNRTSHASIRMYECDGCRFENSQPMGEVYFFQSSNAQVNGFLNGSLEIDGSDIKIDDFKFVDVPWSDLQENGKGLLGITPHLGVGGAKSVLFENVTIRSQGRVGIQPQVFGRLNNSKFFYEGIDAFFNGERKTFKNLVMSNRAKIKTEASEQVEIPPARALQLIGPLTLVDTEVDVMELCEKVKESCPKAQPVHFDY